MDDISTVITEQLTDAQREIESEKSTLKSYVAERLTSDDQILSRLPSMVSTIVTKTEASEDEKAVEQWCKAIISFRTAEIKARVDTVYLTSLSEKTSDSLLDESEAELQGRKEALQAELEELHAEVASIAEMVVEHELRKPMVDIKERNEKEQTISRTAWLTYVRSIVWSLTKPLVTNIVRFCQRSIIWASDWTQLVRQQEILSSSSKPLHISVMQRRSGCPTFTLNVQRQSRDKHLLHCQPSHP